MAETDDLVEQMRKLVAAYDAARKQKAQKKTAQLNVKITPSFKAALDRLAAEQALSLSDLIERAVWEYAKALRAGPSKTP